MTPSNAPAFATIMFLTGIGIPILAALNAGLGMRLGNPMAATVLLFVLTLVIAVVGAAITGSLGAVRVSGDIPLHFYFGGVFMAFYIIAVTFIAPRFGVGNAIFFVLVGQLVSAAAIDHFGLFGAIPATIDTRRVAGIILMIAGVYLARRTA